jgi:PAS domain S-box-containing protein
VDAPAADAVPPADGGGSGDGAAPDGGGRRGHAWRDGPLGCPPGGQATLFLDRHGYVIGCAPAGLTPVGWHVGEIYGGDRSADGDPTEDLRAAVRRGSVDVEGWWARATGARCWVQATLTALRGAGGTVTGFALVLRDASAARDAEEALRRSEARLAGIVELAREAIVSTDDDQAILLFNRGAERIFGYAAGEVLGCPFAVLLADPAAALPDGGRGGGVRERRDGDLGHLAARRRDGSIFTAAASLSSVEVDGGRVHAWMLRDVTAELRASADAAFLLRAGNALASSLAPADTLATAAALGAESLATLCLADAADPEGPARPTAWAGAAPEGADLAAALARGPHDPAAVEPIASALRAGAPRRMEAADADALRAAGWDAAVAGILAGRGTATLEAIPLAVHGRLLGSLTFVLHGGRVMDEPGAALARALAARTAQALESALLYERACRAAQLRDEMVSVVSHDLRNPLGVVAMSASLLTDGEGGDALSHRQARSVDMIRRAAEQMTQMVEDLLDVARIESGGLALARVPVPAGALLADAAELLRPQAEAGGVALEVRGPADAGEVSVDAERLRQVFSNLVGNALKFTPAGGTVTLSAARGEDGAVRFCVRDTGSGIPAEHLPLVFDRFWQARRMDRRGLGLGLPIVKGIVEAHGGRVWAESEPGHGAAFWFTVQAGPPPPA